MAAPRYIRNNAGTLTETIAITSSAGVADAEKIVATGTNGLLDITLMPTGISPPVLTVLASENLAAGDFVNIYNNGGTANVRKADATTSGKEAHGFVLSAVLAAANATVYFGDSNTAVTGRTAGVQYLSTTAGSTTTTAPSGSGNVIQRVGVASSATEIGFLYSQPIVLA